MAKKLKQTKYDYINFIAEYMHKHHISFKTLEQTKQTWRIERAYTQQIEQELIDASKLFMSLLDQDLNLQFRARMVNFIARYLAAYVSKSKEFADAPNADARMDRAYTKLNNQLLIWLDSGMKAKKSTHKATAPRKPMVAAPKPKYTKRVLKQDDKIVQEITFGNEKVSIFYDDLKAYRANFRADLQRVIGAHTK